MASPLNLLFLGSEWVSDGGRRENWECRAILTKGLQLLGARRGCEMGRVSLFLCLDVK
jgi:hypothetical protein